jgi:hypothetical protein
MLQEAVISILYISDARPPICPPSQNIRIIGGFFHTAQWLNWTSTGG